MKLPLLNVPLLPMIVNLDKIATTGDNPRHSMSIMDIENTIDHPTVEYYDAEGKNNK